MSDNEKPDPDRVTILRRGRKVLPCPCCGSAAESHIISEPHGYHGREQPETEQYIVSCIKCGAEWTQEPAP
jgi:uncharacterized Zn finger protein